MTHRVIRRQYGPITELVLLVCRGIRSQNVPIISPDKPNLCLSRLQLQLQQWVHKSSGPVAFLTSSNIIMRQTHYILHTKSSPYKITMTKKLGDIAVSWIPKASSHPLMTHHKQFKRYPLNAIWDTKMYEKRTLATWRTFCQCRKQSSWLLGSKIQAISTQDPQKS